TRDARAVTAAHLAELGMRGDHQRADTHAGELFRAYIRIVVEPCDKAVAPDERHGRDLGVELPTLGVNVAREWHRCGRAIEAAEDHRGAERRGGAHADGLVDAGFVATAAGDELDVGRAEDGVSLEAEFAGGFLLGGYIEVGGSGSGRTERVAVLHFDAN